MPTTLRSQLEYRFQAFARFREVQPPPSDMIRFRQEGGTSLRQWLACEANATARITYFEREPSSTAIVMEFPLTTVLGEGIIRVNAVPLLRFATMIAEGWSFGLSRANRLTLVRVIRSCSGAGFLDAFTAAMIDGIHLARKYRCILARLDLDTAVFADRILTYLMGYRVALDASEIALARSSGPYDLDDILAPPGGLPDEEAGGKGGDVEADVEPHEERSLDFLELMRQLAASRSPAHQTAYVRLRDEWRRHLQAPGSRRRARAFVSMAAGLTGPGSGLVKADLAMAVADEVASEEGPVNGTSLAGGDAARPLRWLLEGDPVGVLEVLDARGSDLERLFSVLLRSDPAGAETIGRAWTAAIVAHPPSENGRAPRLFAIGFVLTGCAVLAQTGDPTRAAEECAGILEQMTSEGIPTVGRGLAKPVAEMLRRIADRAPGLPLKAVRKFSALALRRVERNSTRAIGPKRGQPDGSRSLAGKDA